MSICPSKAVKSASSLKQPALSAFYMAKPRKMMKMEKTDVINGVARDMDWPTAVQHLSQIVALYASRIAAEGQYSREAVARSIEIQAAWKRIQQG